MVKIELAEMFFNEVLTFQVNMVCVKKLYLKQKSKTMNFKKTTRGKL